MSSKYLKSLSTEDYDSLVDKLLVIQNNSCFICNEPIDKNIQTINIDHIQPLANKGKDSEENFAATHESCNKSKQDADLKIARVLNNLKKIQIKAFEADNKSASLKHVLVNYGGSKYKFQHKINNNSIEFSFSELGDNKIYNTPIHTDSLADVSSFFLNVPLEYVYHDNIINPRGINSSISKLVKEFSKKNPQLHLGLARLEENCIKIFDGQHKAVAQILLGATHLLLRIFIKADIDVLTETNTNAGSTLSQVAFDKSVMRQLNNTLYNEKIKQYQNDHNLKEDDFSFSEQNIVEYFKGENANLKKYIIDSIKHSITEAPENKLKDFLDREGKAKDLPISYSAFDKTFLAIFIDSKNILNTPIDYRSDEGMNPRELEINQCIGILNILAEEIYINKFNPEIGVSQIENKILKKQDNTIQDEHLIAYRMSKEEVMYNWLIYIKFVIKNYFSNTGKLFSENSMLQEKFDDQLWKNIRNFIVNLRDLPLWKDRSMASTTFSGKRNYDYWENIFKSGKTSDGVHAIAKPLNIIEMIK
ncbi:HNH endonuclease [Leptospira kanakyensis]|uniref:HNH endonuclease n=1 Tax=Leptospira kanakyensis TaxID=2484968 RepID=UPI00223E4376|nr:HNH endonuclease signature motif containing protein [Leptospira kanakyensis]MCW7483304.1 HNH endonuclease [Leptospira kanakyensis]